MAVFVWKALNGDEAPPACTGVFNDVPCPSQFADYIEGIYNEGITAGCGGDDYCPDASITNAQMAVFLVKAFRASVPGVAMKRQSLPTAGGYRGLRRRRGHRRGLAFGGRLASGGRLLVKAFESRYLP